MLGQEPPALVEDGYTSFKVFMTYEGMALSDMEMLSVMSVARGDRRAGDGACGELRRDPLPDRPAGARGQDRAALHGTSRPIPVEREATHRAISLAELVDVPIMIVHVSNGEAMEEIRRAQQRGLKDLRRDLPAISGAHRERHGRPQHGGRGLRLLAAARRDEPEGVLGGAAATRVLAFPHPTIARSATTTCKASSTEGQDAAFAGAERHSGVETRLPILFSSEGVKKGRIIAERVRGIHRDQPRQDLRAVSEEGHHRGRLGCRRRDLGSGAE